MATADRLSKFLSISLAVLALIMLLSTVPTSAGEVVTSYSVLPHKIQTASNLTSAPLLGFDGLSESLPDFFPTASLIDSLDFPKHTVSSPYRTLEVALFVLLFFKIISIGSLGFYYITLS